MEHTLFLYTDFDSMLIWFEMEVLFETKQWPQHKNFSFYFLKHALNSFVFAHVTSIHPSMSDVTQKKKSDRNKPVHFVYLVWLCHILCQCFPISEFWCLCTAGFRKKGGKKTNILQEVKSRSGIRSHRSMPSSTMWHPRYTPSLKVSRHGVVI